VLNREFDQDQELNRLQGNCARQEAESKAVAALATRLRLTHQSRYTPHGAAAAGRKNYDGPKPWEM
jgi:hypothetical protein